MKHIITLDDEHFYNTPTGYPLYYFTVQESYDFLLVEMRVYKEATLALIGDATIQGRVGPSLIIVNRGYKSMITLHEFVVDLSVTQVTTSIDHQVQDDVETSYRKIRVR